MQPTLRPPIALTERNEPNLRVKRVLLPRHAEHARASRRNGLRLPNGKEHAAKISAAKIQTQRGCRLSRAA